MRTSYLNIQNSPCYILRFKERKKKKRKENIVRVYKKIPSNSFQGVTRFINERHE